MPSAPPAGTIEVTLRGARGLKEKAFYAGKRDPYTILTCGDNKFRSTTHTGGGEVPVWNQVFTFTGVLPFMTLKLEFFDEKMLLRDQLIGESKIPLQQVFDKRRAEVVSPVFTSRGKQRGEATLSLVLKHWDGAGAGGPEGADARPNSAGKPAAAKAAPKPAVVPAVAAKAASVLDWRTAPSIGAVPARWILDTYANTDCWLVYEKGRLLGQGAFGKTYVATHKKTGVDYAAKVIAKRRLTTAEEVQDVKNEVEIMHHLAGHPNVVKLDNVFETREEITLVMELMSGGGLLEAISKRKGNYSEKDAATLFRDIVSVVAKCHAESVIHRDIKPDNFLLTDNTPDAKLKAADFGLSSFFKEGQRFTDCVGSLHYMAPEVLLRDYSKEADIWSCGVILFILLSGHPPFGTKARSEAELVKAIKTETLDLQSEPWGSISDAAKDCLKRMLRRDPKHRAKAEDILKHEWLLDNGCISAEPIEIGVITRMRKFNQGNKLQKAATAMMVAKLPLEEINGLRDMFQAVDVEQTGRITLKQFADAVKRKGGKIPEKELREMWNEVDIDGDGYLQYEEFLAATINSSKLQREERLKSVFNQLDIHGFGFIGREELREGLKDVGISDAELEDIIAQADGDGTGTIDYNEFCAMMRAM